MTYQRRLVDDQLDELMAILPAIAIEGAKGVGKTETATGRSAQIYPLDNPTIHAMVDANPELVLQSNSGTTFIDEWQRVPSTWDLVRRAVDKGANPGRFLLAGSASLNQQPTPRGKPLPHSGAGRIVRVMMRPMSLPERGVPTGTVSLSRLLSGERPEIAGSTTITLPDYTNEILTSGFPGIRAALPAARPYLLDSYIDHIVDHDVSEAGQVVRRPTSLLSWLTAYGAATATTASYASLLNAASPGEDAKPSKITAMTYRDLLQRLWVVDPLPAWSPVLASLKHLGQSPKHHLVDPGLAARLVGATADSLISGQGPVRSEGVFLGALFESLSVQTIRSLAQSARAKAFHLRTHGGEREIDLIIQRPDLKIVAFEIKLSSIVRPADIAQLTWLKAQMPDLVLDTVLINTGPEAYRRKDGVAVVPLALLTP